MRYFDFEKIEQGKVPLSPTEQDVRERLVYEIQEQLITKMDLEAALEVLTPQQRVCFLRYAEGATEREIAHELRLSRGNVHAYLEVARTKLRRFFQQAG